MLLSYASDPAPQSRFEVDWVRVRKECGTDPTATVGPEMLPNGDHTPVANSQSVSTPHDVPVTITLTASDLDGRPLSYNVTSGPAHGSLTGSAPNLVYTPAPNYHGQDAFVFQAFDGQGYSNLATVSITVSYVDQPPTAYNRSVSVNEGSAVAVTLAASHLWDGNPQAAHSVLLAQRAAVEPQPHRRLARRHLQLCGPP